MRTLGLVNVLVVSVFGLVTVVIALSEARHRPARRTAIHA
jgi:hypothetical protein